MFVTVLSRKTLRIEKNALPRLGRSLLNLTGYVAALWSLLIPEFTGHPANYSGDQL